MQNKALMTSLQNETWAMEPIALNSMFQQIASDYRNQYDSIDNRYTISSDGVAIIKITGTLMKNVPSLFKAFGIDATSYTSIINNVNQAASDDEVKTIILDVDSPGGQVSGVEEAADAIYAAGLIKEVKAVVTGGANSGAYWLASQANKIEVGNNAVVGSIGVYSVYIDASEMAKSQGIEVKIIRSGEHKGMGVVGAPVTESQVEAMQKVIDGMASNFIKAVARGRKMKESDVKRIADGRVFIAKDAKENGLVDLINKSAGANGVSADNNVSENKESIMTDKPEIDVEAIKSETEAATVKNEKSKLSELKAAFPDDLAFAVEQYEANATIDQAKAAYSEILKDKLAVANQEVAKAKEEAEKAKVKAEKAEAELALSKAESTDGTEPIKGNESGSIQKENFMSVARELAKTENISMTEAMRRVAKEQPELHASFIGKTS